MRITLGSAAAALALCLFAAAPAGAAGSADAQLKADINSFLGKLEASSQGLLKWQGADRMDVRDDGDGAVADITGARISIGMDDKPDAKRAQISFDHLEIRRVPAPDGASKLSFVLPQAALLTTPDHDEIKLTLNSASGSAVIDAQSGRTRESQLAFAGARLDDKKTGDWVSFGPLSWSGKLTGSGNGGWTGPMDLELKKVEFFVAQGPANGAIDRIAYTARSSGPDLAALNRLRDRLDAMREENLPPEKRLDAMLDLLPNLLSLFTDAKGEGTIEGLVVRPPKGDPLVSLKKASIGVALTGLSGDEAALRITVGHDGLTVAPALLAAGKVPHHAIVDIGLENVGTGALRGILQAASKMRAGAKAADKEQAQQQMIGAAAMLNPTFRIYNIAVDTPDVGIEATGEAKGSPLSPKGYAAQADIALRGIDALEAEAGALGPAPALYLPLLKEIGTPAKGDDGTPRLKYHLTSTMQQLLTVNGSDFKAWLVADDAGPGQPRILRPALPVMTGADVSAVQHALAAAKIAVPQSGAYDGATAAAVFRFQKANALNADGIVDTATRQKLGVKPTAAEPPAKKRAN